MTPGLTIALLVLIGLIIVWIWNKSRNVDEIDRNLLQAVKGNRGLARRLLAQARAKYPGKSERWYAEKVIYDLERDRAGSRGPSTSYRFDGREIRENIFLISSVLWLLNSVSYFVSNLLRGR